MNNIAAWIVENKTAQRVQSTVFNYERDLEELLENEPGLIEPGFTIIGRQLHLSSGIVDLLGIDTQGQFTIVEIKKSDINRDAIAQSIDYASELAIMPYKELREKVQRYLDTKPEKKNFSNIAREFRIIEDEDNFSRDVKVRIIGIGLIAGVERMINFLTSKTGLDIAAVGFQVFEIAEKKLLIRDMPEPNFQPVVSYSNDAIIQAAKQFGTEKLIQKVIEFASLNSLKIRPYKNSFMVAPPQHGNRCLFTLWIGRLSENKVKCYVAAEAFDQFFGISQENLLASLGKMGEIIVTDDEVVIILNRLSEMLAAKRAAED